MKRNRFTEEQIIGFLKQAEVGIPKESFPLFIKECEFRFNYGTPKQQLKTLKEWADI